MRQKVAAGEIAHQGLVHRRIVEDEVVDIRHFKQTSQRPTSRCLRKIWQTLSSERTAKLYVAGFVERRSRRTAA
jgi:hypothetical protein